MVARKKNPSRNAAFPRGSFVTVDGKTKRVKNLGWLVRHWKGVESFTVWRRNAKLPNSEAYLLAHMRDGSMFESDFASFDVMLGHFLDRPIFQGASINVLDEDRGVDANTTIGSLAYRRLYRET